MGVPALNGAGPGDLPFPFGGWAMGLSGGEGLVFNCSSANLQRSSLLPPCDKKRQAMGQSFPGCQTLEALMQANAHSHVLHVWRTNFGGIHIETPQKARTVDWRPRRVSLTALIGVARD